ncbi:ABC transporter permease subunit [Devosia algicola]|uniref:ABC transporter permease subunit n=1 Tax=Devosia algicola TaxID=3026418 RepID=A0ABY7YSI2_9HYPH|nr:ABC transporter permease subunit [Devosia algicola]WDR04298.1 ABC transporter permease subunit [Devosia algicola]
MAIWSPGVINIIIAIVIVEWVLYARTVRGSVLVEKERGYIEAAESIGVSTSTILSRHLLPNVLPPIIVIANIRFGSVIILEASLVVSRGGGAGRTTVSGATDPEWI